MRLRFIPGAAIIAVALTLALAPSVFARQHVYSSGTIALQPNCGGDVDDNIPTCGGGFEPNYDVYYLVSVGSKVLASNETGDTSWIVKTGSKPTYATCKAQTYGHSQYNAKKNVGKWFCVQTNEGRYSRVQITKFSSTTGITISYKTWCVLNELC